MTDPPEDEFARLNKLTPGTLVELLGIQITAVGERRVTGTLTVRPELLAPNGFLHAATVIALADTLCGYGYWVTAPAGSNGFTTIELKANFLGTARAGTLTGQSTLRHGGRTTQIWDAEVTDEQGKLIALFRCTQLVLYPRT